MKMNLTSSQTAGAKATGAANINEKAHSGHAERMKRPEPTNETDKALHPVKMPFKSPVTRKQTKSQVNDRPEEKAASEAPFRTITAEQAKSLYHAVLEAYITEARASLKTANDDNDPKTAAMVYEMEFNIGCLLRSHTELTPAEMVDLLPNNINVPMTERIPELEASRTLFFLDHLHRILFRPGEAHPDERILQE